jgi:hypothetical protein
MEVIQMEKRKTIKKKLKKIKEKKYVIKNSAASQNYLYYTPTEYRILIPGLEAWGYGERACIYLRQDNTPIGQIVFYKEGHDIPDDDISENGDIYMHLPFNMFESVLDILRHEKPIKFEYNVLEAMAFFGTDWEPVGEEE